MAELDVVPPVEPPEVLRCAIWLFTLLPGVDGLLAASLLELPFLELVGEHSARVVALLCEWWALVPALVSPSKSSGINSFGL